MKLKIRYENTYQTIELSDQDMEQLWVSLELEGDGLTKEEKEQMIRDAWEEKFNRPDYVPWHRFYRHIDPKPKKKRMNGKRGYIQGDPEDEVFDIMDYLRMSPGADECIGRLEDEKVYAWIIGTLRDKPHWVDAFIAVRMEGMSVKDYAASIGEPDASIVSKWLKRAEKNWRKILKSVSFDRLPRLPIRRKNPPPINQRR